MEDKDAPERRSPSASPSPKRRRFGQEGPEDTHAEEEEAWAEPPQDAWTEPPRQEVQSTAAPTLPSRGLTEEQLAKVEERRRAAVERKQQLLQERESQAQPACPQTSPMQVRAAAAPIATASPTSAALTSEQLAQIKQKRLAAIERRRLKQLEDQEEKDAENKHFGQHSPAAQSPAGLSEEQRKRIEQNRFAAMERRRQQAEQRAGQAEGPTSTTPGPDGPSEEQLSRIEQNRIAALERRKFLDVREGKDEGMPSPASPPTPSTPSLEDPLVSEESSSESDSLSDSDDSDSSDSSSDPSSDDDREGLEARQEPLQASQQSLQAQFQLPLLENTEDKNEEVRQITEAQRARMERNRLGAIGRRRRKQIEAMIVASKPKVPEPKPKDERNAKQALVAKLLCRWWYVLPEWPPADFDYDAALEARSLRRVDIKQFPTEAELDDKGRLKVFQIPNFAGCYRDEQGNLYDVRPAESCPCYERLMLKTVPQLHVLIVKAYEGQLAELEAQPVRGQDDLEYRAQVRKELAEARQKAGFFAHFMPKNSAFELHAPAAPLLEKSEKKPPAVPKNRESDAQKKAGRPKHSGGFETETPLMAEQGA